MTPPTMQPAVMARSRSSVFWPSIAAKKIAVKARYQEVMSQAATPWSPITVAPEML